MSNQAFVFVLDASVALKLFFEQPGSEKVDALFARYAMDPFARFYVPEFFYAECVSALVNYVRLMDYNVEQAREDLEDLLAIALYTIPTADLSIEALNLSLVHGISRYDAFYVALSHQLNAPLITADEKLVHALVNKPYRVVALSVFEI